MSESFNFPPWHPITDPVMIKHLGKLLEESGELVAATSRCLIQGLEGLEPTTKKINRQWLEEEIADVLANSELVMEYCCLDKMAIYERAVRKKSQLKKWHDEA